MTMLVDTDFKITAKPDEMYSLCTHDQVAAIPLDLLNTFFGFEKWEEKLWQPIHIWRNLFLACYDLPKSKN